MPEILPKMYIGNKQITGLNGESAYQVAAANGYTGTENEFNIALSSITDLINGLDNLTAFVKNL